MIAACVLRSGGDFSPDHVQWLARQVPGLVCLSDVRVPGVKTIPLQHDWPGWWAKMEMFGPALKGDVMMLDLDTVVREVPKAQDATTVLRDFTDPTIMGSGLMFVKATDRERVWAAWMDDPAAHMRANRRWPKLGDQGFLQEHIGGAQKWQDVLPGAVVSYKMHCRKGLPEAAKVICFHGNPRPWKVSADWIPPMIEAGDFSDLILKHAGQRICVMGGAPSLTKHLEQVEADVFISVNCHGAERPHDYVLAMDERHGQHGVPMGPYLRERSKRPIISPRAYGDYMLRTWPDYPKTGVLSGMVAAWVAWVMGAQVVILAGMDGYDGSASGLAHAAPVIRDVRGPIRVVGGGPLTKFWPEYSPEEQFGAYAPHPTFDTLKGVQGMSNYRALKPFGLPDGRTFVKDQEFEAERHDMERPLKHRLVEEIEVASKDGKQSKPSKGLDIDQLKAALTEKCIEFAEDAKRADLAKLLDDAVAQ